MNARHDGRLVFLQLSGIGQILLVMPHDNASRRRAQHRDDGASCEEEAEEAGKAPDQTHYPIQILFKAARPGALSGCASSYQARRVAASACPTPCPLLCHFVGAAPISR